MAKFALCIAAMPSRRGFAKLTTDDGAEDSDGTEIIEDDASSPGVDRGAFGEMFALAQSVGADDAEVEEAASAVQDTGSWSPWLVRWTKKPTFRIRCSGPVRQKSLT